MQLQQIGAVIFRKALSQQFGLIAFVYFIIDYFQVFTVYPGSVFLALQSDFNLIPQIAGGIMVFTQHGQLLVIGVILQHPVNGQLGFAGGGSGADPGVSINYNALLGSVINSSFGPH